MPGWGGQESEGLWKGRVVTRRSSHQTHESLNLDTFIRTTSIKPKTKLFRMHKKRQRACRMQLFRAFGEERGSDVKAEGGFQPFLRDSEIVQPFHDTNRELLGRAGPVTRRLEGSSSHLQRLKHSSGDLDVINGEHRA